MHAAARRFAAAVALVVCVLPLAACEPEENPARDPGKPVTSAELRGLGCC